ncbi:hypothetical protein [Peribacillus sp. JNUCC41]|uniref:hypothetical protein n=1 Tax=Peribacillus sp. JNUCC41 TaxID=2778370 RepID=UPI00178637E9|nr:hypothetical protein [Brevibacillus sp. JNUCC-41]QOS89233.1 hypothetical protein JNUCC41_21100 [Brevibacillus sp. JNUCC-41]
MVEKSIDYQVEVTPILATQGKRETKTYNWVIKIGQRNNKYYGSISCKENGVKQQFSNFDSQNEESVINKLREYCRERTR